MTYLLGTKVADYELRDVLHAGHIITTYKGYQESLKRDVVVQTLSENLCNDQSAYQALIRAAEFIASFEHPNILPILDFGLLPQTPYTIMRYMKGGTLQHRLKNNLPPFHEVIAVIKQIGSALDYVHSKGSVHGDPSNLNIVFDNWGSAYLSDFLMAGFQMEVQDQGLKGVPVYMAPERWQEQNPTPASDQYALAIVAYEMLTGQTPFVADNMVDLMVKHLHESPSLPQKIRLEVPTSINPVLLRALAKDPADRYPTVMDFVRDFEKSLGMPPSHVFISYSRRDMDYAKRLKQHLKDNGLPVWLDDEIEHGDQWFNEIHDAVKGCGAFLVIMTPESEKSEWVHKEVLLAKRYKKLIFPLLLNGAEFPILIDIQYADVRDGHMPNVDFHRRLSQTIFGVM